MVSQWCDNGTICQFLKHNPEANRLRLVCPANYVFYQRELTYNNHSFPQLTQVASGTAHLHTVKPTIIHGDLKGVRTFFNSASFHPLQKFVQGNILVDQTGSAIITDFGLSKVMEEMSDSMPKGTSFFAGSTRWMAPELIFALVEDDGIIPPITTYSDVYAFASVCLEVCLLLYIQPIASTLSNI